MTEGLRLSRELSMTKEATAARMSAGNLGYDFGAMRCTEGKFGPPPTLDHDPYLQYLWLLGVAKAIQNHARELAGYDTLSMKVRDTEGRKPK